MASMWNVIEGNIMQFIHLFAKDAIYFAGFAFVIYEGYYLVRRKWKLNMLYRGVHMFARIFYLVMILGITLFSRQEAANAIVNLTPFSTMNWESFSQRMYVYENILLFVPAGILFGTGDKRCHHWYLAFLFGVSGSLAIECTQYITKLGRFEVDDILTNVTGMMLGYMVVRVFQIIWKGRKKLYHKLDRKH